MEIYNRKEIRRSARHILKTHYLLLVVLMMLGAFLGINSSTIVDLLSVDYSVAMSDSNYNVMFQLIKGDIDGADETANAYLLEEATNGKNLGHVEAGREKGIFADMVNRYRSGSFSTSLAKVIFNIVKKPNVAGIICMLLALLVIAFKAVCISEVSRVVVSRILLEIRIYKRMNYSALFFLVRTRKWFKVAFAFLRKNVFLLLWSLTIVGAFVKYYAYAQVRFILAENPDLTGKQALQLSQNMMKGHKWELFLFDLSFLPWDLVSLLTGTVAGLFFVTPYKAVARMEYYANLRARCKEDNVEGMELLTDEYLYIHAEGETIDYVYSDVIEIMNEPEVVLYQPSKARSFFQDVFGFVLRYDKAEIEYRKNMANKVHAFSYDRIIKLEAYPTRLCPTPVHSNRRHLEHPYYMRHYSLPSLVLIFFSFCFVGWLWEVAIHIVNDGRFVNRGVMHGPWLPIYGTGAVMILLILNKLRKLPVAEFFSAIALCGVVEYFGSWALEKLFDGQKWWDYTGYFLNINGRICAEGLLVFGLAGVAAVYFVAPLLDNCFSQIKERYIWIVSMSLIIIFILDMIYSSFVPNTGEGITDYVMNIFMLV